MSMGKGPGGGGLTVPAYTPQTPYEPAPTTPFQPYQPPQPPQQSFGRYNPMMDMYGSGMRVMQPMPNYFSQFGIPGGGYSGGSFQPPPAPAPYIPPAPPPLPPVSPPQSGVPPLNTQPGYYNAEPLTDETYNAMPMDEPQQLQGRIEMSNVARPPANFSGGINPGGMYTQPQPAPVPSQNFDRSAVFSRVIDEFSQPTDQFLPNLRTSITAEQAGVPASQFQNQTGRRQTTIDLSGPGRGSPGVRTINQVAMPILDAAPGFGRRPPGRAIPMRTPMPVPIAPPPQPVMQRGPGFGGYINNVRINPYMGAFNFRGIM